MIKHELVFVLHTLVFLVFDFRLCPGRSFDEFSVAEFIYLFFYNHLETFFFLVSFNTIHQVF